MKAFSSVKEMIDAGFCHDRQGRIMKIDSSWRIGIPDDDVILSYAEVNLLLDSIDPHNRVAHLLIGLMFRTGARISQNLNIRVCDIDFGRKRVHIMPAKEGIAFYRYLDDGFLAETEEYIKYYDLKKSNYLFSVHYLNRFHDLWRVYTYPINRRTANRWIDNYSKKAGLQYYYIDPYGCKRRRIHTHTAKYTVASWIYQCSRDVLATALCVGNKTTAIMEKHYIRVLSSYRKEIVENALEGLIAGPSIEIIELEPRHENKLIELENIYQNQK